MSHLVFVSHATQDLAYAEELVRLLEAAEDVSCWFGVREIPLGADYAASIVEGVNKATAFVILCSESSADSEDCLRELSRATKRRMPRFPVRLDYTEFEGGFGYRLELLQWINGSAAEAARSILDELGVQHRPSAADDLLELLSGVARGGYETDDQTLDYAEAAWLESDLATRREVVRDRGLACIELVRAEVERRREGERRVDLTYFTALSDPGMGDEPEHVADCWRRWLAREWPEGSSTTIRIPTSPADSPTLGTLRVMTSPGGLGLSSIPDPRTALLPMTAGFEEVFTNQAKAAGPLAVWWSLEDVEHGGHFLDGVAHEAPVRAAIECLARDLPCNPDFVVTGRVVGDQLLAASEPIPDVAALIDRVSGGISGALARHLAAPGQGLESLSSSLLRTGLARHDDRDVDWIEPEFVEERIVDGAKSLAGRASRAPGEKALDRTSLAQLIDVLTAGDRHGESERRDWCIQITAGPGFGKTTLARHLFVLLAGDAQERPKVGSLIPIMFAASTIGSDLQQAVERSLVATMGSEIAAKHFAGRSRRLMVIVDALDQAQQTRQLEAALADWSGPLVLLGRIDTEVFARSIADRQFRIAEIRRDEAIALFSNYLRLAGHADVADTEALAVINSPNARNLVTSPLLVTLLAWWWADQLQSS